MIEFKSRLQGEYNIHIKRGDGTIEETGWFKNLILNQGLDRLGETSGVPVINYAQVGSGTATPTATDTQLQTYVAGSSYVGAATSATSSGAPDYYAELTYQFVFAQGTVVATIAEVGVGWDNVAGSNLFSRARILDGSGNPTTLSITSFDQLTVFYRVRIYPPVTDTTGTLTIGSTPYNYTIRAANISGWASVNALTQSVQFSTVGYANFADAWEPGVALGPITGSVTGSYTPNSSGTSTSMASYVPGTYYTDGTITWGVTQANGTGGFQGITWRWGIPYLQFSFQMVFDAPIPKDNTKQFNITFRFSWARI